MSDRTGDFFKAATKFGHRKGDYLEIRVGERNHGSYKNSYITEGIQIFRKIYDSNNLLRHLIQAQGANGESSSIFDASHKMTIQIKDEITGINFEISDLK